MFLVVELRVTDWKDGLGIRQSEKFLIVSTSTVLFRPAIFWFP